METNKQTQAERYDMTCVIKYLTANLRLLQRQIYIHISVDQRKNLIYYLIKKQKQNTYNVYVNNSNITNLKSFQRTLYIHDDISSFLWLTE